MSMLEVRSMPNKTQQTSRPQNIFKIEDKHFFFSKNLLYVVVTAPFVLWSQVCIKFCLQLCL